MLVCVGELFTGICNSSYGWTEWLMLLSHLMWHHRAPWDVLYWQEHAHHDRTIRSVSLMDRTSRFLFTIYITKQKTTLKMQWVQVQGQRTQEITLMPALPWPHKTENDRLYSMLAGVAILENPGATIRWDIQQRTYPLMVLLYLLLSHQLLFSSHSQICLYWQELSSSGPSSKYIPTTVTVNKIL